VLAGGTADWREVPAAERMRVDWLLKGCVVAIAVPALSWMVGLPHRPLERQPRLEAARSLTTRTAQRSVQKVTLGSADVHYCHQTWDCESGSHRSRSLLLIPFRG
jgi:hypothetical protein